MKTLQAEYYPRASSAHQAVSRGPTNFDKYAHRSDKNVRRSGAGDFDIFVRIEASRLTVGSG